MADSQKSVNEEVQPADLSPPITMKLDSSTEDDCQQENDDHVERKMEEEFVMCSPTTNQHLVGKSSSTNSFGSNQYKSPSSRSSGILKPPQLSVNNSNQQKSTFTLNPSRLNPFLSISSSNIEEPSSSGKKSQSQVNGETPKFVPLIHDEAKGNSNQTAVISSTTSTSSASSRGTSFIFGQNLQDRVLAGDNKNDPEPTPSTSLTSNGTTSEMLFSSAVKSEVKPDSSSSSKETKSLSESAREYEESRANKRKYEEVEVRTGEEGETNILNFTCKLFAYDKNGGSWQERGRGVIRLNDIEEEDHHTSRLVFRATGSLRVVLNTKIWAEMTVEQASDKSVRFTALDPNGEIKVFLAMASIEDSKHLCSQLKSRIEQEVSSQKHKKVHTSEPDSGGN